MRGDHKTMRLFFMGAGRDLGMRYWVAVPRVGDSVRLGGALYRVDEVCWGVAVDDDVQEQPSINIAVTYLSESP